MNRVIAFIAIFLLVFALVLGAVWFLGGKKSADSSGQNPGTNKESPGGELTQKSGDTNPGSASVDVTLVTKENASEFSASEINLDKEFVFYVEMNTHSIGLSEYKMEDISTLLP